MKDIGVFSFSHERKGAFLSILHNYLNQGYVRTIQENIPYFMVSTPLSSQLENTKAIILPKSFSLEGLLAIQKPKSNQLIRIFVGDVPNQKLNQKQSFFHDVNTDYLKIGNYCHFCSQTLIILCCNRPIEAQLEHLLRFHFADKQYKFVLSDYDHYSPINLEENLKLIKEKIKKFAQMNNLFIDPEMPCLPSNPFKKHQVVYNDINTAMVDSFFRWINEPVECNNIEKSDREFIFKIVALHSGEECGSTTFFEAQIDNNTDKEALKEYDPTIFMDIHIIRKKIKGNMFTFEIFDFSGNERWRFLSNSFLQICDGVFLFYNMSKKFQLNKVRKWVETIQENFENLPIEVIGTKKDLISSDPPELSEITWMADFENIVGHMETSALTGEGLEESFYVILKEFLKYHRISLDDKHEIQNLVYEMNISDYPLLEEVYSLGSFRPTFNQKNQTPMHRNISQYLNQFGQDQLMENINYIANSDDRFIQLYGMNTIKYCERQWAKMLKLVLKRLALTQENLHFFYFLFDTIWFYINTHIEVEPQITGNQVKTFKKESIEKVVKFLLAKFDKTQHNPHNIAIEIMIYDIILSLNLVSEEIKDYLLKQTLNPIPIIQNSAFKTLITLEFSASKPNTCLTREELYSNLKESIKDELVIELKDQLRQDRFYTKINAIEKLTLINPEGLIEIFLKQLILAPKRIKPYLLKAFHEIDPLRFTESKLKSVLSELNLSEKEFLLSLIRSPRGIFNKLTSRRTSCVEILYHLEDGNTQRLLFVCLNDVKESIRLTAVKAIQKIGNSEAIIPLLLCHIISTGTLIKREIILTIIKLKHFSEIQVPTFEMIVENLSPQNKHGLQKRIMENINKSIIRPKKIRFINALKYFKNETSLKALSKLLERKYIDITQAARSSLKYIFQNMEYREFCDSCILNLFFHILHNIFHFIHYDFKIEHLLNKITWRNVVQGLLYQKVNPSDQLKYFLANWQQIDLRLLYHLSDLSYNGVFDQYVNDRNYSISKYNTYLGYLISSYPVSLDKLDEYLNQKKEKLNEEQVERLEKLRKRLTQYFRIMIENEEIESFILL